MTASIAHFAAGMAVGTAVAAPRLWRQWTERRAVATPIRRWLLWSYGLGLYAVVPNMLLRCGLPEGLFRGAWANIFLLHPILDGMGAGGMYKGAAAAAAIFAVQYLVILAAIRRCDAVCRTLDAGQRS